MAKIIHKDDGKTKEGDMIKIFTSRPRSPARPPHLHLPRLRHASDNGDLGPGLLTDRDHAGLLGTSVNW